MSFDWKNNPPGWKEITIAIGLRYKRIKNEYEYNLLGNYMQYLVTRKLNLRRRKK